MAKKNNSEGKPYYTQRNNKIKPGAACNVTSIISALSAAGWPVEKLAPKGVQPEDELMRFLITDPKCSADWKRLDPAGHYPPNEWHSILADGANRLVRRVICGSNKLPIIYTENSSAADISGVIAGGGAAAVSGLFALPDGKKLNHIVSVVGFTGSADAPDGFILDDPWGDYRTGYAEYDGNDVEMPMTDFLSIIKFPGLPRKMAHLVRAYA